MFFAMSRAAAGDSNANARAVLADHLIAQADRFVGRGWIWIELSVAALADGLQKPGSWRAAWARRSRVAATLVREYRSIAPLLGGWPIKVWLALRFVPLKVISRLGKNPEQDHEVAARLNDAAPSQFICQIKFSSCHRLSRNLSCIALLMRCFFFLLRMRFRSMQGPLSRRTTIEISFAGRDGS